MVNLLAFAGISFIEKIKAVLHISIHTVFPIACKHVIMQGGPTSNPYETWDD